MHGLDPILDACILFGIHSENVTFVLHTDLMHKTRKINSFGGILIWMGIGLPIFLLLAVSTAVLGLLLGSYLYFSADLPNIPDLKSYRSKTVSTFYAEDGTPIGVFYREKRFPVRLDSLPAQVINSFLAAEDARFFSHPGIDVYGVARAIAKNFQTGNFAQGGSTITQQVTRNFLLSKEKKISRKIREVILSFRLEKTLSKNEILELYVNEIYLGKGAYGIESAAKTYFSKNASELTLSEAAMLAGIVANPNRYSPSKNFDSAVKRRDFVLSGMLKNEFITEEQYQAAMLDIPVLKETVSNPHERAPYFTEAVRQYVMAKYGENRLYNEGLQVWTTCDVDFQNKASEALVKGAKNWERRQGRPIGLIKRLKAAEVREFLNTASDTQLSVGDRVQALVLTNNTPKQTKGKKNQEQSQDCTLALQGNRQFRIELPGRIAYKPNDLLEFRIVDMEGTKLILEHYDMPQVQGAVVCIENNTGYVKALVGGLDFEKSSFNRAIQSLRQPGSAFKPFIYATALENADYGPNSLVVDDPIAVKIDANAPDWLPLNSDGRFAGPMTLRQALAQSRNIASIKILMDTGIAPVIANARNMGIKSNLAKNLSLSLGSSEVTPLELTSAYTVFGNLGTRIEPVFVKRIVDRFGNVIEDNTMTPISPAKEIEKYSAESVNVRNDLDPEENPSGNPRFQDQAAVSSPVEELLKSGSPLDKMTTRDLPYRALTPRTSYAMLGMMRDVVVNGTASSARKMNRNDIVGKTGTTDDYTDAWFIGLNPDFTTGVWMGHETKVSLGRGEQGAAAALPIWMDFMGEILKGKTQQGFPVPADVVFTHETPVRDSKRTAMLLESGPDFVPTPNLKPICPVDIIPADTGLSFTNSVFMQDPLSVPAASTESVRILSASGETLGYGIYTHDAKGKLTVYPYAQVQTEPEVPNESIRPPQRQAEESGFPFGADFLRELPKYLPFSTHGWFQ